MIRSVTLALALALSATISQTAAADSFDDCSRGGQSEARLRACGDVIANPSYGTEQKAYAYAIRGRARANAGALTDSIADFSSAIGHVTTYWPAWSGRAAARLANADPVGALADYDAALRLAPDSSRFQLYLERGHAYLTKGDIDAAIADLSEAVRRAPANAVALNNRGLAWRRKGNLELAYADYTAALMINPIYAQAYANRGYLEEARGRAADAVWNLRQALVLDPSIVAARRALERLGAAGAATAESDQRSAEGKALTEQHCARCHAVGSSGDSPNAKAPPFRDLHRRHALLALREPITRGIVAPHDEMPRFDLTPAQVDSVVAYVNSLQAQR